MKPFFIILRTAFKLFVNRDRYIYFYGAKGEIMTDGMMNALIAAYPEFYSRYSAEEINNFKNQARGKIGLDCSGFITACAGLYGSSAMLWDACTNKTSVVQGKAGYYLFKHGESYNHCGLDIGYGYCMHCPGMGQTIRIDKIQAVGFQYSGALPDYDYTLAQNY